MRDKINTTTGNSISQKLIKWTLIWLTSLSLITNIWCTNEKNNKNEKNKIENTDLKSSSNRGQKEDDIIQDEIEDYDLEDLNKNNELRKAIEFVKLKSEESGRYDIFENWESNLYINTGYLWDRNLISYIRHFNDNDKLNEEISLLYDKDEKTGKVKNISVYKGEWYNNKTNNLENFIKILSNISENKGIDPVMTKWIKFIESKSEQESGYFLSRGKDRDWRIITGYISGRNAIYYIEDSSDERENDKQVVFIYDKDEKTGKITNFNEFRNDFGQRSNDWFKKKLIELWE